MSGERKKRRGRPRSPHALTNITVRGLARRRTAANKRSSSSSNTLPPFLAGKENVVKSNIKWVLALGVGVVGGWAARSLSDSPEGAGVKLLEIGIKAKEKVDRWAAVERERLEDMLAEARSNISSENEAASKSGHK